MSKNFEYIQKRLCKLTKRRARLKILYDLFLRAKEGNEGSSYKKIDRSFETIWFCSSFPQQNHFVEFCWGPQIGAASWQHLINQKKRRPRGTSFLLVREAGRRRRKRSHSSLSPHLGDSSPVSLRLLSPSNPLRWAFMGAPV